MNIAIPNYHQRLFEAKPVWLNKQVIKPPKGALGAEKIIPELVIPPINTNIDFSTLPPFNISKHKGLAALSSQPLEVNFNWRDGPFQKKDLPKKDLISKPPNQMLCGSCWAVSSASVIGDVFVVSGIVDGKPDISPTYALSCYPQNKCSGGNPALLLQAVSKNGIKSKHCVDYSWCATNSGCNGSAQKHFEATGLNLLIPKCGCYNLENNQKYYNYKIENVQSISGNDKVNIIKAHIRNKGPVVGSFLVYSNFRSGAFTKTDPNKGIYLEDAVYSNGSVKYQKLDQGTYIGSHAVSIIGWGIEKDVQINSNGDKKDVPYWFVRNSWTDKWGDKGYFKMPIFLNTYSQFTNTVRLQTNRGLVQAGGMIIFTPNPDVHKITSNSNMYNNSLLQSKQFYVKDDREKPTPTPNPNPTPNPTPTSSKHSGLSLLTKILIGVGVGLFVLILGILLFLIHRHKSRNQPYNLNPANKINIVNQ